MFGINSNNFASNMEISNIGTPIKDLDQDNNIEYKNYTKRNITKIIITTISWNL